MLFLFLGLISLSAHAQAPGDPAWRALLHFSGTSGGTSSVHERSSFFLSPEGHRDPRLEFEATVRYFDEHPEEAACRFPARAMYLGRPIGGKSELCERWQKWKEAISAKGAELVFAAAFISSPSSMYGHTLLKFVRSGKTEGEDLLDYTLNYGANTGNVVGLPYVWLGLTGGFNGNYATAPFYIKVREYNFVENRDFWIYPLRLSEEELRLLVAHAWELRNVEFPYFFLHRNCSYYLLELLEVLRPGSELTSRFAYWTVPMDTIRWLKEKDWLGPPKFRASRYRRLKAYRSELGKEERELVEQMAETGEIKAIPPGREALLLDSAYELWRYRNEGKKDVSSQVERKLLSSRSLYSDRHFEPSFPMERAPDSGHPTSRFGFAYGQNRVHDLFELSYRGTLHDLLADSHGYEEFSELSMGDLRLRMEDRSFFLERFDLLRLRSLAPHEHWIPRFAWSFRGGFARAKEFACKGWGCSSGVLEGGWGASALLGPILAFTLFEGGVEVGRPFDHSYRVSAGPSGGILTPLWPGSRLLLEGEWRFRLLGSELAKRGAHFGFSQAISRVWEIRAQTEIARGYREGLFQLFYSF